MTPPAAAAAAATTLIFLSISFFNGVNGFSGPLPLTRITTCSKVPLLFLPVHSSRRVGFGFGLGRTASRLAAAASSSSSSTIDGPFINGNGSTDVTQQDETSNIENEIDDDDETENDNFDWLKQWYPVLPMSFINDLKLDEKPFAITLLNQDLVIWKTAAGEFSILQDTCPHRRAQLSTGKIYNDTLACRYHGWEFDKQGACAKIPMMPQQQQQDQEDNKLLSKAFCVNGYTTQIGAGMLWIYMDPSQENPAPLSPEILNQEDSDNVMFSLGANPISWQSLIENSFDPSHAPFTHEGPGFGMDYSPDTAIPITEYEFTQKISKSGFALRHTPYQLMEGAPPGADKAQTTREFISPITSITKSPMFNSTIYFVPIRPGETLTIGSFASASGGKAAPKMPKFVQDAVHFFLFTLGDGMIRFLSQDRVIMQAQDRRKMMTDNMKWEDMYPTQSDRGVKAMQTWARKFGRPFFTMPKEGVEEGRQMSVWDRHAKYCPECHRSIARVAAVKQKGMAMSNITFLSSLVGVLVSAVWKKASSSLLKSALVLLILSVGMRYLSNACSTVLERVFVNPSHLPKYQMMNIYKHSK